jgi:hypothetical protein
MNNLTTKLGAVQAELKAPKDQRNTFGNYNYRSAEGILEAVKPLLAKHGLVLAISDTIEAIGGRIYVKATSKITDGADTIEVSAYAREPENKKGADESQITGACSSYARKYSLNGLFLIDDTRDPDATNDHGKGQQEPEKPKRPTVDQILTSIAHAMDLPALEELKGRIKATDHANNPKVKEAYEARSKELF